MPATEFIARAGSVDLGGSVWLPDSAPVALLVMCPGSGAADRHNGLYFAPIREHLLERGCAICSFDKRGVGSSSGHWQDADIPAQSEDVLAVVAAALTELPTTTPVGLFGHSQGGWVVLE